MEPRRIDNGREEAVRESRQKETVVIPVVKRRRARPIQAIFFLLLLAFFAFCVWLTGTRLRQEINNPEGHIGAFFVEQGIFTPKQEKETAIFAENE